jgi:hypothetical protein
MLRRFLRFCGFSTTKLEEFLKGLKVDVVCRVDGLGDSKDLVCHCESFGFM